MNRSRQTTPTRQIRTRMNRTTQFALGSALAAAMVVGFAGSGQLARAGTSSETTQASSKAMRKIDAGVAKAEAAVAKNPQNAAVRSALANAYLTSGRFESAASAFNDAIALGDNTPRTALSLALAHIGSGRNREAVALLDQWRDSIPAGDHGLALALAGETSRGVEVLVGALRGGQDTPKLRQNLAYAYALDGRWNEARIMASQDVPADKLDDRISKWAMQGRPEDYQNRIAGLLGVPVRPDSGMPAQYALNGAGAGAQLAAATEIPAATAAGAASELPPVQAGPDYAYAAPAADAPTAAPAGERQFQSAFAARDSATDRQFVSDPVVQSVPVSRERVSRAAAPRTALASTPGFAKASLTAKNPADCTHLVQLGSFASEASAHRAWKIYLSQNPELTEHELTITPAVVRGKKYFRVAAAGFNKIAAAGMCSSVKGRGGACIAYSADRPLPGALPARRGGTPMMAARR